ncbi:MAG: NAD(P)-dependent oxidoreductase [Thermodesulfobacteriota bacterium]
MRNEKILLTGPTSQVGFPLARALAAHNEVHGLARLSRNEDRERLAAIGVKPLALDLAKEPLERVPDDFTYVLNFAVVKTGDFAYDLAANAEAAGRLIAHCRRAKAFLHCSSGGVYQYAGHSPLREDAPLGDNHRVLFPTYSISKIAAETVVRFAAAEFGVPSVIARFSVPYGDNGGWPLYHLLMMRAGGEIPVHVDKPNLYNPIHEDDYVAHVPKLLAVAGLPAVTTNWGGEQVSIEEWCGWLSELTGLEARLRYTTEALGSLPLDLTRMHELIGAARVPWRDGIRRMVQARAPELLR